MKLLVNHSSGNNLGDMAMIEGVVRRLLYSAGDIPLHVKDNLSLPREMWQQHNVTRVTSDLLLPEPVTHIPLVKRVPYLRQYESQMKALGTRCCHTLLGRGFKADEVRISNHPDSPTLGEWCSAYDALHFVGMGGLTDVFLQDTWYYCCLIHTFALQGKPVIFTGQQIGPVHSRLTASLIQRALRKVQFVGLREPTDSLLFCQKAKLNSNQFAVMGDDSFGLPPANSEKVEAFLLRYGLSSGKFIAVNVRIASYVQSCASYSQQIINLMARLSQLYDLPLVVVPIALDQYDSDIISGLRLAEAVGRDRIKVLDETEELSASIVKGVLGHAYAAVGVSYHFCTFALSQGVPAICVFDGAYYSQKARGIAHFWGDERLALSLSQTDLKQAIEQIFELIEDQQFRKSLYIRASQAIEEWERIFDSQVSRIITHYKKNKDLN